MPDDRSNDSDPQDFTPTLSWASDRCIRIQLGTQADAATLGRVHGALSALRHVGIAGLQDITPAYTTLLATFDPRTVTPGTLERVRAALSTSGTTGVQAGPMVEVPICYQPPHAPDLPELARLRGLSADNAARLHTGGSYSVAFIGFTPGFPYITGLPGVLAAPRLSSPRPRIPAGSVGIAGTQTGIYPGGTPGGWRIIGRTPLRIFDPARDPVALLTAGDSIRFVPISAAEFERLNQHPPEPR